MSSGPLPHQYGHPPSSPFAHSAFDPMQQQHQQQPYGPPPHHAYPSYFTTSPTITSGSYLPPPLLSSSAHLMPPPSGAYQNHLGLPPPQSPARQPGSPSRQLLMGSAPLVGRQSSNMMSLPVGMAQPHSGNFGSSGIPPGAVGDVHSKVMAHYAEVEATIAEAEGLRMQLVHLLGLGSPRAASTSARSGAAAVSVASGHLSNQRRPHEDTSPTATTNKPRTPGSLQGSQRSLPSPMNLTGTSSSLPVSMSSATATVHAERPRSDTRLTPTSSGKTAEGKQARVRHAACNLWLTCAFCHSVGSVTGTTDIVSPSITEEGTLLFCQYSNPAMAPTPRELRQQQVPAAMPTRQYVMNHQNKQQLSDQRDDSPSRYNTTSETDCERMDSFTAAALQSERVISKSTGSVPSASAATGVPESDSRSGGAQRDFENMQTMDTAMTVTNLSSGPRDSLKTVCSLKALKQQEEYLEAQHANMHFRSNSDPRPPPPQQARAPVYRDDSPTSVDPFASSASDRLSKVEPASSAFATARATDFDTATFPEDSGAYYNGSNLDDSCLSAQSPAAAPTTVADLNLTNIPEVYQRALHAVEKHGYRTLKWSEGWTALHWAAQKNHYRICQYLLHKGADPNASDSRGRTPIEVARGVGNKKVVQLFDRYREAHALDDDRGDASGVYRDVPEQFAEALRAVDAHGWQALRWADGWTALHWAAQEGRDDIVSYLLARNGDPTAADAAGKTPMDVAKEGGNMTVLKILERAMGK
ncbi:hypothetical protein FOL47_010517 [Perkinsus chesapeaki]|uniref:Uncharacterized protein n=1 Tax=Perkinsus chesapeaki TaxID=330153 RepID=A0A7J6MPG3_PERCH|nr:hypothetical protein FOL47_010517 [Perkinsus chesapeaki]